MDPLTHTAIGLAVAKVTGNAALISDPATMCIVAGSVFPDIDILLQKKGDMAYLKNHRGATHSLVGTVGSSAFIAGMACLIYGNPHFLTMFFWALLGCWAHVIFDLFNSYGAKLFWPFIKKKFSLGMMITFDPVFIGLLAGYIFAGSKLDKIFLAVFILYFAYRVFAWILTVRTLEKTFGDSYEKISLLPSLKGLYKWHFILEAEDCSIICEKSFLRNRIKIVKRLNNTSDARADHIMDSETGRFFSEFTPVYHVSCEKNGRNNRYIFTDMRYFLRNKFLHHAVVETDENDLVIKQTFNPYSMSRCCVIGEAGS